MQEIVAPNTAGLAIFCILGLVGLMAGVALYLRAGRPSSPQRFGHSLAAAEPPRELGINSRQQTPHPAPVGLGGLAPPAVEPERIPRTPARDVQFIYATGDRPLDGYTIKRGIGRGGFGEVYYAVSDGGKEVALKLVQRHLDIELRGVGQCLNLKHPNLVTIYDVRQSANGDFWVVMEYLSGTGLSDVLAASPNGLPHDQVNAWLRGISDGVGYLHEHGIVHRDLKPGNIFIENGIVKIGDYGLAKYISASRRSGQTESVGTVHYMAPEVAHGRYGKEIDLYALGVILYELLTGRVPFSGQSPGEIMMKHLTAQPETGMLPNPYRAVVARLLAKDPAQRFPSVDAMRAELANETPSSPAVPIAPMPPDYALHRTGSWHGDDVRPSSPRRERRPSPATVIGSCIGFILMLGLLFKLVFVARNSVTEQTATVTYSANRGAQRNAATSTTQSPSALEWHRIDAHKGKVVMLQFHPTANRLASVGQDGTLWIHNLDVAHESLTLSGVASAAFSPDGNQVAVASHAGDQWGPARFLDARSGEETGQIFEQVGPITRFAFAPGGKHVASLNDNGRLIRAWNTETATEESIFGKDMFEPALVGIAFRDVRNVVAVDERLQTWLWDSAAGNAASGNAKPSRIDSPSGILDGGYTATCVAFGHNAQSFAAGLDIGRVYYCTLRGTPTALIDAHSGPVRSIAISGQDEWLASCGADGKIRLWKVGSFTDAVPPIALNVPVTTVALNQDGRLLAAGSESGTVVVFKIRP